MSAPLKWFLVTFFPSARHRRVGCGGRRASRLDAAAARAGPGLHVRSCAQREPRDVRAACAVARGGAEGGQVGAVRQRRPDRAGDQGLGCPPGSGRGAVLAGRYGRRVMITPWFVPSRRSGAVPLPAMSISLDGRTVTMACRRRPRSHPTVTTGAQTPPSALSASASCSITSATPEAPDATPNT
jgi:hypothetical protein